MFPKWKTYTKHCALLKTKSETPSLLLKDVCKQIAAFDYYKCGLRSFHMINKRGLQKNGFIFHSHICYYQCCK